MYLITLVTSGVLFISGTIRVEIEPFCMKSSQYKAIEPQKMA
jgi:hypothetical protein